MKLDRLDRQIWGFASAAIFITGTTGVSLSLSRPAHAAITLGANSAKVRALQQDLKADGFNPGPIDGIFGPRTEAAVLAFQKAHSLSPDGIVGPKTLAFNATSSQL